MAVSYLSSVPKLQGRENYEEWSYAMENFLVIEGLLKCIDGSENDSVLVAKAKAKIVLSLDTSLFVHIREASTAKEVWDRLKELYENKGVTRKIGLLRALISLRLENCSSMGDYVNQVIETSQKLYRTGVKLDTTLVGSLLLAGLPERFAPMVMALEHSGIEITTDAIKSKLLDMQPDGSTQANSTVGAFVSRCHKSSTFASRSNEQQQQKRQNSQYGGRNNFDNKNKNKSEIICYGCKLKGHYVSRCPNLNKKKNEGETKGAFTAVFLSKGFSNKEWYLDSGASVHLTCRQDWLINKREPLLKEIMVANHTVVPVESCGEVEIITKTGNKDFEVEIQNACYVPDLTTNLLSVSELLKNGNFVEFDTDSCRIYNAKKVLMAMAFLSNGVYKVDTSEKCSFAGQAVATGETWHKRLGHINSSYLNKMKDGLVEGINYSGQLKIEKQNCEVCCEGKQSRQPFKHKGSKATGLLDLVHSDVAGPMETASIGGSRYFVQFQDDFSRMCFVYFMKTKSETFKAFKSFKCLVEKQLNRKIKVLRTDNGGEYVSNEFENYLQNEGIIHQTTNPYTPEQNGASERMNRSLVEKAKCLLYEAGLDKSFWAEAVNTACYLRNRSAVSNIPKTPYEMFFNRRPDLSHVRIFGSIAMTHIPKEKRRKWDKKSEKLILIGFSETTKGYRVYDPKTGQVYTSRDVVIIEKCKEEVEIPVECQEIEEKETSVSVGVQCEAEHSTEEVAQSFESENSEYETSDEEYVCPSELALSEESTRRSERARVPKRFDDYVTYMCSNVNEFSKEDVPLTVSEALSRPDSDEWRKAMLEELNSFEENNTWELTDVPEQGTIVECKWVYKIKCDSENRKTYRARLVAKGFSQKEGIDYTETFAPVVRFSTLRLLIALAVKLGMSISHLDVKTAFLNGFLEENVYMCQPEGFLIAGSEHKVCKLKKAVYGLKQSSRAWNTRIDDYLIKLGYIKSKYEPCVYIKKENSLLTIVALYVDDFFIFSNDNQNLQLLKEKLSLAFKIKDLGKAKECLGVRIKYDKDKISLDQEHYVDLILKRFGMSDCKSVTTPIDSNEDSKSQSAEDNKLCDKNIPYQRLIGSLMYLVVLTRPDLAYTVSYLSQFNNCYTEYHWKCAKRVLRYLQGTKSYSLIFTKDDRPLIGFVDADWASDKSDRKSYTGFVFKLSGGSISWKSKKQNTVALSSTEAEYMALSEAAKEAIYLRNLLGELTGKLDCVKVFNDNQSALKLSVNPMFHERTKHIDVRYHFVREVVSNNIIKVDYLSTAEMTADILTKGLKNVKHQKFVKDLSLKCS